MKEIFLSDLFSLYSEKQEKVAENPKNMANNKSGKSGAGLGIAAALVAAAAGAYYLYGKNGAKHRKQIKGWALKAKGEVLERIEQMEDVTEGAYHRIIDDVTKQYRKYKEVDNAELADVAIELKKAWNGIKKIAKDANKGGVKKKPSAKKTSA